MRLELDKSKATIGLEPHLNHKAKGLEEWDQVFLGSVGREVSNVHGGVELRSLSSNHLERVASMVHAYHTNPKVA